MRASRAAARPAAAVPAALRGAILGVALSALALGAGNAHAETVGGVEVEPTIEAAGTSLELVGAGLRTRFFIKLYVAALYLPAGTSAADPMGIVMADEPMAITLDIVSDRVTRERMVEALEEGFAASTGGDTAPVQDGIDRMLGAMDQPIAEPARATPSPTSPAPARACCATARRCSPSRARRSSARCSASGCRTPRCRPR